MAGKIIADIIEAPYDSIRMNVGNVTVLTANNSGLTYVPTGNVNINIGGASANLTMNLLTANGIKFPASQVSSGDANTLDDYEEGTFTPVLKLGSTTQTQTITPKAFYVKVGRLVYITMETYFTKSGTGDFTVNSLPFAGSEMRQCNFNYYYQFYTSSMPDGAKITYLGSGETFFTPQAMPSGGTQTVAINDTHFTGSTNYFYVAGTYVTNA